MHRRRDLNNQLKERQEKERDQRIKESGLPSNVSIATKNLVVFSGQEIIENWEPIKFSA